MICAEHEALRQRWMASRADYQLALADLRVTSGVDDFKGALRRANAAFAQYEAAETALNDHVRVHACVRIHVFGWVSRPQAA